MLLSIGRLDEAEKNIASCCPRTSAGVTFEDRGEHALKGIADRVRVFAVRSAG